MTKVSADKGKGAIIFTRGVPSPEAFPIKELQECAKAVLERGGSIVLKYHAQEEGVKLRLPFCALSIEEIQEGVSRLGSIVNMLTACGR